MCRNLMFTHMQVTDGEQKRDQQLGVTDTTIDEDQVPITSSMQAVVSQQVWACC